MDIKTDTTLTSASSASDQCICRGCSLAKTILSMELFEDLETVVFDHLRVEHITPCSRNLVLQAFGSLRLGQEQKHEQFIIKLPKSGQESEGDSFKNEILFYKYMSQKFKLDILSTYYLAAVSHIT
ncbi:hypothetical protein X777_17022 [Ooceraea biroi]|uniref:Uncharacterized protein n=1 Tax=Ooceraea biroi TaxID=2015173 RepID=A0A026VTA9_OOCBI|nr:hypothetical protein X777_17022 [Ooceraea biroi]